MNLVTLALGAPWVVVDERDPSMLHAVTMDVAVREWVAHTDESGVSQSPLFLSACGLGWMRLFGVGGCGVPWPPSVRSIAPWTRCVECHRATGRRRPACHIRVAGVRV